MLKWRLESRDSFYETIKSWWEIRNFPILPYTSIPQRIFVVYHESENGYTDLYAIPVYVGDADLCWIGFPTSNPAASKEQKEGALDFLMDKVETSMQYHGYRLMITTSDTPVLMELFERRNFTVSDKNVNYYTKTLR